MSGINLNEATPDFVFEDNGDEEQALYTILHGEFIIASTPTVEDCVGKMQELLCDKPMTTACAERRSQMAKVRLLITKKRSQCPS